MRLRTRGRDRDSDQRELAKVERRVRVLSERDLLQWATRCVYDQGQHLLEYERESGEGHLVFAERAAESARVIVAELLARERSGGF